MVYFSGLDSGKKERNLKLSDPKHEVQVVLNEHSFAAEQSAVDEVCMCVLCAHTRVCICVHKSLRPFRHAMTMTDVVYNDDVN